MQRNILFVYTVRDRSALEPVLCLKHNLLWLWSGNAQLREPVLFGTNCFVHTVRDRPAPGACFVWSKILLCLRSGTARLWDCSAPGASIGHMYGPGPFCSGSRLVFGRDLFVNTVCSQGAYVIKQSPVGFLW